MSWMFAPLKKNPSAEPNVDARTGVFGNKKHTFFSLWTCCSSRRGQAQVRYSQQEASARRGLLQSLCPCHRCCCMVLYCFSSTPRQRTHPMHQAVIVAHRSSSTSAPTKLATALLSLSFSFTCNLPDSQAQFRRAQLVRYHPYFAQFTAYLVTKLILAQQPSLVPSVYASQGTTAHPITSYHPKPPQHILYWPTCITRATAAKSGALLASPTA